MTDANAALLKAKRIDEACDQFETAWRAGKKPQVEAFLAKVSPAEQDALRSALAAVEKELKSQSAIDTSTSQSSVRTPVEAASDRTAMFTPASEAPQRIGRFEIRGVLGAGAFGKIYRGYDAHLGRDVAIKVPLAAVVKSETDRDRFLKEARSAANINHPNVCQIYEVGEFENMPYIVMPVIPGQSLADAIKTKKEPLPEKQVAQIVRKIASALAAAHDKGIIHRDLKPANVMFDKERKDMIVMDFGLARGPMLGEARATQSGMILGTPAYMSPEQARGTSKDVGPEADIFSLGVILYELLTGVRPFSGTATEVIGQILHVDPKAPSQQRAGIDPRMEAICKKAMAKDPALRFASMRELIAALDGISKTTDGKTPTDDTAKATGTKKDRSEPTSENQKLADVFAVISAERKATAAAMERAVAKHKTPTWIWIALGLLIFGGFSALGGIIFFTQNDKVKVTLEIKDLDLSDKTLSYFFDGEPISAEQLASPIELKPGEHVFVAKRGDVIVKRLNLNVPQGRDPKIVQEDTTPDPNLPRIELVKELQTTSDESDCWLSPDGLAIYFVREGANVERPGVYRAARNTSQSTFGAATYIANARHVAVTADESYLVGVSSGQGNQPLLQARRKDTNESFGDLSPMPQFLPEQNHKSPWLSGDGLSLIYQKQDEKDTTRTAFYICQRNTRRDIWSAPNRIEIESEKPLTLTWPMLTDDGLTLFFGNGGTRFDTQIMYATRTSTNQSFKNVQPVMVDSKPVKGRSPRYVAATNELFFTWDPGSKESPKDLGIYVIKNFHPDLSLPAATTDGGWIELFNGKDLSNWRTSDGNAAMWKVQDGYIEVTPVPLPLTAQSLSQKSIVTDQELPLDFELHAEFWIPSEPAKKDQARGNSGIFLHGRHEIQICDSFDNPIAKPKTACGALYGQIAVTENANLPPETWQSFDITFQSPRFDANQTLTEPGKLTVVLNGKTVVKDAIVTSKDTIGATNSNYGKPGPIQLQAHGSPVRFRNLRIRPLKANDANAFSPLFNGKDLDGWQTHSTQPGGWKVEDGLLTGRATVSQPHHLFTLRGDYRNFHLRAECKTNLYGNGGIIFRVPFAIDRPPINPVFPSGYEAQIIHEFPNSTYALTGSLKRQPDWLVKAKPLNIKPDEWFILEVIANGPRIIVKVNGTETANVEDTTLSRGHIALQSMSDTPTNVNTLIQYRKIEIRELDSSTSAANTLPNPPATSSGNIPSDALIWKGNSYKFYPEQLTWKQAQEKCKAIGGHLIVIDSTAENNLAAKLIEGAGWTDSWIGITDEAREGDWRTIKGDALGYTNWFNRGNQPNNKGAGEHFGLISNRLLANGERINWEWSDQPNEAQGQHKPGYICEWDSVSLDDASKVNWISLFNRKDLTGWDGDIAYWSVVNGLLVGKKQKRPVDEHVYLIANNSLANFELKVVARLVSGNSGVQIRSAKTPGTNFDMTGPQIEITNADNLIWGTLIEATGGQRVQANLKEVRSLLNANDFNELLIRCEGKHITVRLNGTVVNDTEYPSTPSEGKIGLQLHKSGEDQEIHFKEIAIRPL